MGNTYSNENTFPVQVGPDLSFNSSSWTEPDAYVAMVLQKGMYCDTYNISEGGDVVNVSLEAGEENALRKYLIIGAVNSTTPGTPLPCGISNLPFKWDQFSDIVLSLTNTMVFSNFMGTLDSAGQGTAQINATPMPPGYMDTLMYFAYVLNNPFDFVSNPVAIRIVE